MSAKVARRVVGRRRNVAGRNSKPVRGICTGCGCTQEQACAGGCAWVDSTHTLCTACVRFGADEVSRLFQVPVHMVNGDCGPAHGAVRFLLAELLPPFSDCPTCDACSPPGRVRGAAFASIVHTKACGLARVLNAYEPGRCMVEGSERS